jgi:hypothetical protein
MIIDKKNKIKRQTIFTVFRVDFGFGFAPTRYFGG